MPLPHLHAWCYSNRFSTWWKLHWSTNMPVGGYLGISAEPVGGWPLWVHPEGLWGNNISLKGHTMIVAYLKGMRLLNPSCKCSVPQWDLDIWLDSLCIFPYEPLGETGINWLSMKTVFLVTRASPTRVSNLHTLSVSLECLQWGHCTHEWRYGRTLHSSRKSRVQTMSTGPFWFLLWTLLTLNTAFCSVRALRQPVAATRGWQATDQLFVCFSDRCKGAAFSLSKDRLVHWITDTITSAPLLVMTHLGLMDICIAVTWTSSWIFSRFGSD